jgi:hypothetical protein
MIFYIDILSNGRAIAQAVSRWLRNAAARVACEVCGGQSGTGAGSSPSTLVSPAKSGPVFYGTKLLL